MELAEYGYKFGDPIHTQYGRDAVYADSIIGTVDLIAADYTSLNFTVVTFTYGSNSVTITPRETETLANLVTLLDNAFAAGNVDLYASVHDTTYLKIVAKTTPAAGTFTLNTATNAASAIVKWLIGTGGSMSNRLKPMNGYSPS